jgi:uncharacterized domain HDIG
MKNKIGIVITAAGLSARMKEFKPLLQLGNKRIIEHVVDCALASALDEIVVVVGKEAHKIEEVLGDRNIKIVHNDEYATSDMLASVKIGIKAFSKDIASFFVTPGDMPLIVPACYQCLKRRQESNPSIMVTQLKYQGSGGHPILIHQKCREHILNYHGPKGLKGALRRYEEQTKYLEWPNLNILIDMDTPTDYARIKKIYEEKGIPRKTAIYSILQLQKTPQEVIKHSIVVEKVALRLGADAISKGYFVDLNLISAAALLHDVERTKKHHEVEGAKLLERLGYAQVARVVKEHMFLSKDAVENIDERAIVYLADKLVEGEALVGIQKRFEKQLHWHKADIFVYGKIMENKKKAMKLAEIFDTSWCEGETDEFK